jgi:hypothetical protein
VEVAARSPKDGLEVVKRLSKRAQVSLELARQ